MSATCSSFEAAHLSLDVGVELLRARKRLMRGEDGFRRARGKGAPVIDLASAP
jgi:hypothetical protein